ncbi:MAG: pentapeptide repeat-containing protein [Janthinobacterium lividum]
MTNPVADLQNGSPDAATTEDASKALLAFAEDATAGRLSFEGADVSLEAVADTVRQSAMWDVTCGGLRLAGRSFAGASLRRANLSGANLSGADLSKVEGGGLNLTSTSLEGANLAGADLIGAIFHHANGGEANFTGALLEDAKFQGSSLRFARFTDSILDGADLSGADLWGVRLDGATAERANFEGALLDESSMEGVEMPGANLSGATLRRAKLSRAVLRDTNLRNVVLDGADLSHADLTRATLPNVSLATCKLTHARFAGAWLDRTRMQADSLGGMVGEEASGNLDGAIDSYLVLEQNFRSLGKREDESWCYRRRRRVQKQLYRRRCVELLKRREIVPSLGMGARYMADVGAEWLCDYGDSVSRVLRAILTTMVVFAVLYWVTGCLKTREGYASVRAHAWVDYLLFSLDSMTTVGTSEVALRTASQLGTLLSSLQTALGTILLGLFGFVLGGRIRN